MLPATDREKRNENCHRINWCLPKRTDTLSHFLSFFGKITVTFLIPLTMLTTAKPLVLLSLLLLLLVVSACQPDPEPTPEPQVSNSEGLLINEFLAKNDSCCADGRGDFDDWVELYNSSNAAINVGGLYFTDTPGDPSPYQIPTNDAAATTIAPGDYMIIWFDDDQSQGPLHISKKLSASGESIIILESDGVTTVDSYTYSAQASDVSMGRNPDNQDDWKFFTTPTPGAENQN